MFNNHILSLLYGTGSTDLPVPAKGVSDQYLILAPITYAQEFNMGGDLIVEAVGDRAHYRIQASGGPTVDEHAFSIKLISKTGKDFYFTDAVKITVDGVEYIALKWNHYITAEIRNIYFNGDAFDNKDLRCYELVTTPSSPELVYMLYNPLTNEDYTASSLKIIDLSQTAQTSNFRKTLIAVCELTNTNASFNSWSGGTIRFHRRNSVSTELILTYQGAKIYNTSLPQLVFDLYPKNINTVKPCTFVKDGIKYGGFEFYSSAAEHDTVKFSGLGNFDVWAMDHYNTQTNSSLDQTVTDSIVYLNSTEHDIHNGHRGRYDETLSLFGERRVDWHKTYSVGDSSSGTELTDFDGEPLDVNSIYRFSGASTNTAVHNGFCAVAWSDGTNWYVNNSAIYLDSSSNPYVVVKNGKLCLVHQLAGAIYQVSVLHERIKLEDNSGKSPAMFGVDGWLSLIGTDAYIASNGKRNGRRLWDSGNDGAGSGSDADMVDGIHAYQFSRRDIDTTHNAHINIHDNKWLTFKGDGDAVTRFKRSNDVDHGYVGSIKSAAVDYMALYNHTAGSFLRLYDDGVTALKTKSNLRINTDGGYLELGPQNSSYAHIYTDRPEFYFNKEIRINNSLVWNSGNDGPGSGLNADLLDGIQGAGYLRRNADTDTNSNITFFGGKGIHFGSGTSLGYVRQSTTGQIDIGSDDLIVFYETDENVQKAKFSMNAGQFDFYGAVTAHSFSRQGNKVWDAGNDGPGSGLNADLIDGLDSSQIVRSDVDSVKNGYLAAAGFVGKGDGTLRIALPEGGSFKTGSSVVSGAIKIGLPVSWTSHMLTFVVRVYEYQTSESFDVVCSGYNYASGVWTNTSAHIIGDTSSNRSFPVRFGHDGTRCCVYIGDSTASWSYPQVSVTEVHVGFSNANTSTWSKGWSVSFTTTLSGVNTTHTNTQVGRYLDGGHIWHTANDGAGSGLDADTVDGLQAWQLLRGDVADTFTSLSGSDLSVSGRLRGRYLSVSNTSQTVGDGVSLYGNYTGGAPDYGLMFSGTATFGKHGFVQGDWATYLTMNGATNRGWIFRQGSANVASIDGQGFAAFAKLNSPVVNISNITLKESTHRSNLLQLSAGTAGWAGLSITQNDGHIWNLMADGPTLGFYDDTNNKWGMQLTANAGVALYHNGSGKLTTESGGVSITGDVYVASEKGFKTTGAWVNIATAYGYIRFGPANTGTAHIYTDRPEFYFNKELKVNGSLVWNSGNDGSGSGMDADLLDGLQASSFLRSDVNDVSVGNKEFYANGTAGAYGSAAIELREHALVGTSQTSISYAPMMSFHWGGVAQGRLAMDRYGNLQYSLSDGVWGRVWNSQNDGHASGLDADMVDGLNAYQFIRSDTDDYIYGKIINHTDNRSCGMYGYYDSNKINHIWSMGTTYKVDDNGATFGTLYGMAYKHTNNTTGGTMAGGHQLVVCQGGTANVALGMGGNIWLSGDLVMKSDVRDKCDIANVVNVLDDVCKLRAVTHSWLDPENDRNEYGWIAQEVKKIFPKLVSGSESEDDRLSVSYAKSAPILAQAIKEHRAETLAMKNEIESLKNTISELLRK